MKIKHYWFLDEKTGEHRLSWHWQNLGKEKGLPGWREGRAWFRCLGWRVEPSWHLRPRMSLGSRVELGGYDDDLTFSVDLGLARFWLSFDSRPINRLVYACGHHREVSLVFVDGYLRWYGWDDPDEWHRGTPWWRQFSVDVPRLILGKPTYAERDLHVAEVELPLPEATYPATVRMFVSTWKRPRWFTKRIVRADIKPHRKGGVPVPGKGENSYDQDEDAVFSMTTPAASVEEAIGHFIASVLRTRGRYGGKNWRPSEAA